MYKIALKTIGALFAFFGLCTSSLLAQDITYAIKLTESEQFESAEKAYNVLLKQEPNNGDYYYYYGENYLKQYFSDPANTLFKEVAEPAGKLFNKGITVDPTNPMNYIGLGKIAMYNGDTSQAKPYFDKALSFLPTKKNKLIMSPDRQALVLYKIAETYVKAEKPNLAEAISLLERAKSIIKDPNPKNAGKDLVKVPELYLVIGDYYIYGLNDGSNAIENYKKAQALDPTSSKAKLRIGQLWVRARNYNDALLYYKEALNIDSTFAPAYRELGDLYALARQYDNAIANYKKFLSLSGDNISAKIRYASALINAKDYEEAIIDINQIIMVDSTHNDLNRALAYSYYETGKFDKSIVYIQKFLKNAKPEKIRADDYVYCGRAYAKLKNDSLAATNLYIAFQMDTTKTDLLSEIALSYSKLKKYDEGISFFEKKIAMGKAVASDYYNLGKVYYNVQKWDKADTTFATFNELLPDYVQGYSWRARTKSNMDPDAKLGLAKPIYEKLIIKALPDSAKYIKEITEAYSFLSYYYFVQYNSSHSARDAANSVLYCEKVLAITPNDEKAKTILNEMKGKAK